jgi:hypothetical protein
MVFLFLFLFFFTDVNLLVCVSILFFIFHLPLWFLLREDTFTHVRLNFAQENRICSTPPRPSLPLLLPNNCTANNFGLMYSRKRISQNSFPDFIYIFPKSFMILSGTTRSKKELLKPDFNLGSQWCHHEKIINFTPWTWTQAPCIRSKYFVTRLPKIDTWCTHKAVHVKIPV